MELYCIVLLSCIVLCCVVSYCTALSRITSTDPFSEMSMIDITMIIVVIIDGIMIRTMNTTSQLPPWSHLSGSSGRDDQPCQFNTKILVSL